MQPSNHQDRAHQRDKNLCSLDNGRNTSLILGVLQQRQRLLPLNQLKLGRSHGRDRVLMHQRLI